MKRRLTVALICLLAFLAIVAGRLVQLQLVQADQWRTIARRFQEGELITTQHRGRIYDRRGLLLAQDARAVSIALDNYNMTRPDLLEDLFASHLKIPRATLREKLYRPSYFTWIARALSPEQADALEKAAREGGARGLIFLEDWKRRYPQKNLASNLIGFTNIDGQGLEGLELAFDATLRGEETVWSFVRMADGTQIRRQQIREGQPGRDLLLTIDSRIQQLAEGVIARGVRTYKAKAGIALVLDPWSGEVLAMAQDETYDLNNFQDSHPAERRNLAVIYPFEPGSSFKIFTMLAALEAGVIALEERISGSASHTIANHTFRNADQIGYGMVTPTEVIKDSINTAMIRIAQRLGEERFYEALKKFGFGQKTGIEMPGEVSGHLPPLQSWSALEIGSIAIGQSVSVTAVQLASRVAAVANGGQLIRPRIVKAIRDPDNTVHPTPLEIISRIASEENCKKLTKMMIETVRDGTGVLAQIEGYTIAAKTGTGQKAVPGKGYVKGKYTSSFVGFFPAEAPRYVVVVVLDEPGGREYYGSMTAAPLFKEIVQGLIYLDRLPKR